MLGDIRDLVQRYGNDEMPPAVDEPYTGSVYQKDQPSQNILELGRQQVSLPLAIG